jgi:hypothetical protein
MIDLFESLPFPATTLIVAAISVVAVALLARITPPSVSWAEALILPGAIAYTTYWAPVWIEHRTNIADYYAWEPITVGCWGFAGVLGSVVCVYVLNRRRRTKPRSP